MLLLALAILPVIALATYIYIKDRFQREPLSLLLLALLCGALTTIPVVLVENFLQSVCPYDGVNGALYTAFVVAGCTEEGFKLLALYLLIWRNRHFDEYFDGIVYAAFVSLGFAGVENIMYVFGSGVGTGVMRALLSVPAHFLFAVVMGYFFALAKFYKNRSWNMLMAFLVPMLLHGIFDGLLMVANVSEALQGVCLVGFIIFDIILWKIGKRRMRQLEGY
jgi:RsiW-degrading membrane proteinase PrsW (M82 family)